jgi:RNA polymerase sigma-70 factor (ECF subfamily)
MTIKDREFEALVHAYSADVYRFAFWLCKNASLAEDMTQETFARAWKSIDCLVDDRAAKAWLITILRREIARHFSRKRPDTIPIQDLNNESLGATAGLSMQDNLVVHDAIFRLDVKYREPLLLQVLGGYNSQEIAKILELNPAVVLTRVFRARQKLRQALNPNTENSNVVQL